MSLELIYPQNSPILHRKQGGLRIATEDLPEIRFSKHPEFSIYGNTSLDNELIYMMTNDPELDCLISTDINKSINPCSIYIKIIEKLCLFESQDIETLITDYKPSRFWDSLDPMKKREFIEETVAIQEEKEQEALEAIETESTQEKRLEKRICLTWRKGS